MSKPKNPDTIIIKNEFYPKGLTEGQVYDYYQKIKPKLLKEVIGKNLTFFFAVDTNKIIVMRKAKTPTGFIRLNYENYDDVISGRSISIHSNMDRVTDIGIVDIDIDNFNIAKTATANVYNILGKCKFIDDYYIKYTGKESFHIVCELKRSLYTDNLRTLFREFFESTELSKIYTINKKRTPDIPNIDLSSNKYLGSYITLHSLSVDGLKSMIVQPRNIMSFRKEMAKI